MDNVRTRAHINCRLVRVAGGLCGVRWRASAPPLARTLGARGLRMGVTKGRVSQIEQGKFSGHDVLVRYAAAL